MESVPIFTVGYGQRTFDELSALLKSQRIDFLIDVRSTPASRFQPDFSRSSLEAQLKTSHVRYVFMGDALGGRPSDPSCYSAGHVIYDAVRERDFFKAGINRLHDAVNGGYRVCLLCAERKPEECHRSKLIGVALQQSGVNVLHFDSDDRVVSQGEVLARLAPPQRQLFGLELRSRKAYRATEVPE